MTSAGQRARAAAELAGVRLLGRSPLKVGTTRALRVAEVLDGHLRYRALDLRKEASADGLLDHFVRIASGDDVVRFAMRFGVLGLCVHGLPASHNPRPLPLVHSGPVTWCEPAGWPHDVSESIEQWLLYAARAAAIVELAAYLHGAQSLTREADRQSRWALLYHDGHLAAALARDGAMAQDHLTRYVNDWIAWGDVRPILAWPELEPASIELRGGSLFGLVAVQLATSVAGAADIYVCDGCRRAYPRAERPPQAGRRNYCQVCKDRGVDERDRKREWRRKHAAKEAGHGRAQRKR